MNKTPLKLRSNSAQALLSMALMLVFGITVAAAPSQEPPTQAGRTAPIMKSSPANNTVLAGLSVSPTQSPVRALPSVSAGGIVAPTVAPAAPAPTAPAMNPATQNSMALSLAQALPFLMQLFSNQKQNPFVDKTERPLDEKNFGYEEKEGAEDVLERINRANNQLRQHRQGYEIPVAPGCKNCEKKANADARFNTCNQQNSYFEDFLETTNNPRVQLLKEHRPHSSTLTCIAESQRMATSDKFVYCPQPNRPYLGNVSRACVSENLVKSVASAFELTTDCLADWVDPELNNAQGKNSLGRALFQLVNHESRWSVNAVSHTGAGGLGQLVGGLIGHVNRSEFPALQNHIQRSSNASCQKLAKSLPGPMNSGPPAAAGCDRMTLSHGPQLNLMYTLAHMKMIRRSVAGTVDQFRLKPADRDHLMNQLAVWGHNVGSGGIAQIFRASAARHGAVLRSGGGNVNQFLKLMATDVHNWHRSNSRRNSAEPTRFLYKTQTELLTVESKANGRCGEFL